MPVVAVAVAIGASAFAASAVAAVGLTVVTALEVTAAVGATVSAVGAVTKDPALQIAGTALGAIGGVGALAAGAGLLGADAASNTPLFGATPAASTSDAASAGTIDSIAGASSTTTPVDDGLIATPPAPPGGVGSVDPTTGNVITAPTSGADAAPTAAASGDTSTQASAAANAGNPATAAPPAGTDLAPQDAASVQASTQAAASSGTSQDAAVVGENPITTPTGSASSANTVPPGAVTTDAPGQAALPTPPTAPGNLGATDPVTGQTITSAVDPVTGKVVSLPDSSGALSGLLSFANKNPVVALGALQAGGSLLSGLTSTLTPAQVSALNAQANANNAAAAFTAQQTANLAMPKSVASSAPVTGTPQTLVPGYTPAAASPSQAGSTGLINKAPAVTGAPAPAMA